MDARKYLTASKKSDPCWKLKQHLLAIRENQEVVAEIILFLSEDPPNAEAAREALTECDHKAQIGIWSCSTKDGGMWERWQRDALKYGVLTDAYRIWCARLGIPYLE